MEGFLRNLGPALLKTRARAQPRLLAQFQNYRLNHMEAPKSAKVLEQPETGVPIQSNFT